MTNQLNSNTEIQESRTLTFNPHRKTTDDRQVFYVDVKITPIMPIDHIIMRVKTIFNVGVL